MMMEVKSLQNDGMKSRVTKVTPGKQRDASCKQPLRTSVESMLLMHNSILYQCNIGSNLDISTSHYDYDKSGHILLIREKVITVESL